MKNGNFTIFFIEQRIVAQSPWLKPNESLQTVLSKEWNRCGDRFYSSCFATNKPANDEWVQSYQMGLGHGWFHLAYAMNALARLIEDSDDGKYDHFDVYGYREQAIRREFRVIKRQISYQEKSQVVCQAGLMDFSFNSIS